MIPGLDSAIPKSKKKKRNVQRPDLTYEQLLNAPKSNIFEVRIRQAEILKTAGNQLYTQKPLLEKESENIEKALKIYQKALTHLDFDSSSFSFNVTPAQHALVQATEHVIRLNISKCLVRLKDSRAALKELTSSGLVNPKSPRETSTHSPAAGSAPDNVSTQSEPATPGAPKRSPRPYIPPDEKIVITARFVAAKAHFNLDELDESEELLLKLRNSLDKTSSRALSGEASLRMQQESEGVLTELRDAMRSQSRGDVDSPNNSSGSFSPSSRNTIKPDRSQIIREQHEEHNKLGIKSDNGDYSAMFIDIHRYLDMIAQRRASHRKTEGRTWRGKLIPSDSEPWAVPANKATETSSSSTTTNLVSGREPTVGDKKTSRRLSREVGYSLVAVMLLVAAGCLSLVWGKSLFNDPLN